MDARSIVGLVVSPVVTVFTQFVLSFVLLTVYVSAVEEASFAITWSEESVVMQFLLAVLISALAVLKLKRRQIRWHACALTGLFFGIAIGLFMAGDFNVFPFTSVLLVSDVAVSWSLGFVCFWAIVFRSNRSATGGESVPGR